MVRLLLGLSLLSACCAAPQATSSRPTTFVAEVVSVEVDYVLGRPEGQAHLLRLELPDSTHVREGSRLYVQGELDNKGQVSVSSFQVLND